MAFSGFLFSAAWGVVGAAVGIVAYRIYLGKKGK